LPPELIRRKGLFGTKKLCDQFQAREHCLPGTLFMRVADGVWSPLQPGNDAEAGM
jgi:hypothetical protein